MPCTTTISGIGILNVIAIHPALTVITNAAGPLRARSRSIHTPATMRPAAAAFAPCRNVCAASNFRTQDQNGTSPSCSMMPGELTMIAPRNAPGMPSTDAPRKATKFTMGPGTHPNNPKAARKMFEGSKPLLTNSVSRRGTITRAPPYTHRPIRQNTLAR